MPIAPAADAVVIFGITGDLAAKMLLPALARLADRGVTPRIVGVAHAPRDPAEVLDRVHERLAGHDAALAGRLVEVLAPRFTYVGGDLEDPATYASVATALEGTRFALFYLAIPPDFFTPTIQGLARAGLAARGGVAIEKPFGHDLASARAPERTVDAAFAPDRIFRIDHYLGKDPVRNLADMRARTRSTSTRNGCARARRASARRSRCTQSCRATKIATRTSTCSAPRSRAIIP